MRYGTKVSPATTIHQRGSGNTTVFETDHARTILALKDFTDLRVESLSEELVEYMARRNGPA